MGTRTRAHTCTLHTYSLIHSFTRSHTRLTVTQTDTRSSRARTHTPQSHTHVCAHSTLKNTDTRARRLHSYILCIQTRSHASQSHTHMGTRTLIHTRGHELSQPLRRICLRTEVGWAIHGEMCHRHSLLKGIKIREGKRKGNELRACWRDLRSFSSLQSLGSVRHPESSGAEMECSVFLRCGGG